MPKKQKVNEREPILRRALMRLKPDYFSCTAEAQEHYRVTMPENDTFHIQRVVLQGLFGMTLDTEAQLEAALAQFIDAQYLRYNATMLPIQGIGEDYFFLNESFGDKTMLDFPTLYDYDYDDHCFQEQALQEEDASHTAKPYRGNLSGRWARLSVDGVFFYATLSSAAGYIFDEIHDAGGDIIQELIPHEYVKGKYHGQEESGGIRWDMRADAGGLETQLDELRRGYWKFLAKRQDALLDDFDVAAQERVYFLDKSQGSEPQIDIVFTDKTALQAIRLRHFLQDCRKMGGNSQYLEARIKQERHECRGFLEKAYQDIVKKPKKNKRPSKPKFKEETRF